MGSVAVIMRRHCRVNLKTTRGREECSINLQRVVGIIGRLWYEYLLPGNQSEGIRMKGHRISAVHSRRNRVDDVVLNIDGTLAAQRDSPIDGPAYPCVPFHEDEAVWRHGQRHIVDGDHAHHAVSHAVRIAEDNSGIPVNVVVRVALVLYPSVSAAPQRIAPSEHSHTVSPHRRGVARKHILADVSIIPLPNARPKPPGTTPIGDLTACVNLSLSPAGHVDTAIGPNRP